MWDIIGWLVVGALAGWVASMIMKTDAQMGAVANIVAGIVGALVGGWLVRNLMGASVDPNAFSIPSLLTAIVGACIVIFIVKLLMGGRSRRV